MSFQFHLIDSITQDMRLDETEQMGTYCIHLFGSSPEGKPVRILVTGFQPFFYVEIPQHTARTGFSKFTDKLNRLLQERRADPSCVSYKSVQKQPMYGYSGGKPLNLVEIHVQNRKTFYDVKKLLLDANSKPIFKFTPDSPPCKVFDASLDPLLRFFHLRNLQPCGWVAVDADLEEERDGSISGICDWESVYPVQSPPMASAPLLTNFWDIECYSESGDFPMAKKGDPVIQIGNVLVQQGKPTEKHIFVLGECADVPGAVVHSCKSEKELLIQWASFMVLKNPDIFVGYNIFGFDERYVWERAAALNLVDTSSNMAIHSAFQDLSRLDSGTLHMKLIEKFLSSSALGDNTLYMWNTIGRLQIDLYHYVKRNNSSLPSYKLDDVCQYYMSGKLSGVDASDASSWKIKTKQTGDVVPGRYIVLLDDTGDALVEKMKVLAVEPGKYLVVDASEEEYEEHIQGAVKWAMVKDDVSPAEIFRLHKEGGKEGRARVAAYCVQDCDLVYELYKKLDVFNNAMAMANVCSVPVSYIFTRGQGIKIESLIFKECFERGIVVEVLESPAFGKEVETVEAEDKKPEESYEGAIVLDPVPGFYTESPIGVCDFSSLYPSTIISENISHDSLVWVKDFDMNGNLVAIPFGSPEHEKNAPPGTRFTDIDFDIWRADPNDTRQDPVKIKDGIRICRYAQHANNTKHTLPDIVAKLLKARKDKRKEAEKETDPFRKALLDAEQLTYKLTANSLYGQLGSSSFKIRLQHLAASTTAYGRKQILFAKAAIEKFYGPEAKDPRCSASVVYGDTDSLFVDFRVRNPETGELLQGTEAVKATMDITAEAGAFITGALKAPHDFEYDKVFDQFIIFSKKRYVGNKYEESPTEFKQTSMGIVMKRRDNAPVLKRIYGGALQILLNERDVPKAARFVQEKTMDMVQGQMSLSQLTITKSLKSKYKPDYVKEEYQEIKDKVEELQHQLKTLEKNPRKNISDVEAMKAAIASSQAELEKKQGDLGRYKYPPHKILADRMWERDPGNAPTSGERMGFVYIAAPPGQLAPKLQGDRIESPEYIQEKGLQPDYRYYIEHQLMKPVSQLFGLVVEQIPGYDVTKKCGSRAEREAYAVELLFTRAFQECDKMATRASIKKMFGVETPTRPHNPVNQDFATVLNQANGPVQNTLVQPQRLQVQSTLNNFFQGNTYQLHKLMVQEYSDKKKSALKKTKKQNK